MPEPPDDPTPPVMAADELLYRLRATPGLASLVDEALVAWRRRAATAGVAEADGEQPPWRAFSDAFPTFWEFTNRPR